MRIDNKANMLENTNNSSLTGANGTAAKNEKSQAAKNGTSDNGLTINGSMLNLGEDLVEEKRKKARSMAVELMMNAYDKDRKLDETVAEHSAHAKKLLDENEEARSMIADIRREKENINEIYGVAEDSGEAADLEILRKGRDAIMPEMELSKEEYARYKELYANGLSDYHRTMLTLDENEKVFLEKIEKNNEDILGDYAFNRGMGIERLKTHDMLDAKKQGQQIIDAASKEIIGDVMQEAVDRIDEDMENKKEDALEKKEEQKKLEERIERAKGEAHKDDDDELIYELDNVLDDVTKLGSENEDKTPEKSMGLMVAQLQLTAEDVKGLVVDTRL